MGTSEDDIYDQQGCVLHRRVGAVARTSMRVAKKYNISCGSIKIIIRTSRLGR